VALTPMQRIIALCLGSAALLAIAAAQPGSSAPAAPPQERAASPIEHLIVIYLENWTFDALYGTFPGVDGIVRRTGTPTLLPQVDRLGTPLPYLPTPPLIGNDSNGDIPPPGGRLDPRFLTALAGTPMPNRPFDLAKVVPLTSFTGDLAHRFYNEQVQIDDGRMDKFAAYSDNPGLVLTYYDLAGLATETPTIAHYAKHYTIADRWFHAAFGDSWHNHFWLLCACTPQWLGTPPPASEIINPSIVPTVGGYFVKGNGSSTELRNPQGTPTWYLVEQPDTATCDAPPPTPTPTPTPGSYVPICVPLQPLPNIGDRLVQAGLDWGWYRGDIDGVLPQFLNYARGTTGYARYMRVLQPTRTPATTFTPPPSLTPTGTPPTMVPPFLTALALPSALPAVSFLRPSGLQSEHPGGRDLSDANPVADGERLVAGTLIPAIMTSTPYREKKVAIVITYDEHGGRWDHVAPPRGTPGKTDQFGPGSRVPAVIISPWARRCHVDHTQYDTTSIAAFIEKNWRLTPLTTRDAAADPLSGAFDFSSPPLPDGQCAATATPTAPTSTVLPTATPTLRPLTQTAQALTATPTVHPLTQTAIALTGTPTATIHPLTLTAIALTGTPTPTLHPLTQTAIALTGTPTATIHPLTQTAIALTGTPTDQPATRTVLALTRTSTPVLAPTAAPNGPLLGGTPGVPAAAAVGQIVRYVGSGASGVSGAWTRTGSGTFAFSATNTSATIVPGSIPALTLPTTAGNEGGLPRTGTSVCTAVGAGPPFTTACQGTTVGNVVLGAPVVVTFATLGGGTAISTGSQVVGAAVNSPPAAAPSALPPAPPQALPPPPPPIALPPPPSPLVPVPRIPDGPPLAPLEVPLIPEADVGWLVVVGLGAVAALGAWRRRC